MGDAMDALVVEKLNGGSGEQCDNDLYKVGGWKGYMAVRRRRNNVYPACYSAAFV